MTVLTVIAVSLLNILCFVIGARIGQKTANGESIELPTVNPINQIRAKHDRRKAEEEAEKLETILRNIESYDGTGKGQKDI